MEDNNLKKEIFASINHFSKGDLFDSTKKLFEALGYSTERLASLPQATYKSFKDSFIHNDSKFNEVKALTNNWQNVDLLFQLTKEEILKQTSLFDTGKFNNTIIESYLFMAIELDNKLDYSRTNLSNITREINRLFAMPVMVLFKTGNLITLAVINRRLNKKDESKDVLEKVTLIKDINITNPHRAHVEILFDLSFEQLKSNHVITNFVELHTAWQNTLDTKELNKKFFNELANWYFWAIQNVAFPDDTEKDKETRNATNVIRLITRITFVWFLKEKKLVPDELFDETKLKGILNYTDKKKSTYYKAILQNLFFATLNTEMGKRKFRTLSDGKSQSAHYFIHNLFRYEKEFIKPKETLEKYFAPIPFLNGGLFECLDKQIEEKGKLKSFRIDGFSDREDNILKVPDELFFGLEKEVDLNSTYGTKNKKYKVKGLINILNSYKFTITENTPIEEEIALDPELLGKVFENLLANYNEETKTTARKQTGSFYTPREIVNYMVDESLVAYYKEQLKGDDDFEIKLRDLLSYSANEPDFSIKVKEKLIHATDSIKIIDPACGSGAFPMGILQKLVHILHKLDPKNELWKQRQIEKAEQIDDADSRDAAIETIEEAFENNELDYGRKLYLIENCIYGVDLQPVAVQISKLRFFISLIVDQKTTSNKENLGVRPLPNLETKFVAANTLIGIEKSKVSTGDLFNVNKDKIDLKKEQLRKIRHSYFEARTPKRKEHCRERDKQIREDLTKLLSVENMPKTTAELLASWNPYDQNASSPFFDMEWMFGISDGCNIVIGNPPYRVVTKVEQNNYKSFATTNSGELYSYFFELAIRDLLKRKGIISFITASLFVKGMKFKSLRNFLTEEISLIALELQGDKAFENVQMPTAVLIGSKQNNLTQKWNFEEFIPNYNLIPIIENNTIPLMNISSVMRGFEIGKDQVQSSGKIPIITGSDVSKWGIKKYSYISNETYKEFKKDESYFSDERVLIRETGSELTVIYVEEKLYCNRSLYSIKVTDSNYHPKYIAALLNSKLFQFYYTLKYKNETDLFPKIRIAQVNQLPIKKSQNQSPFINIVDYVICLKLNGKDSSFYERLIDAMTYELYLNDIIIENNSEVIMHLKSLPKLKESEGENNLKIINKISKELTDPKHPLSAALLKLLTIEEINIIEGRK